MQIAENLPYKKHVLVCVNEREIQRKCCANTGSKEVFLGLKKWVMEKGLTGSVWVTKTGCLGFCNEVGATVVLYPEKKWFLQTKLEDLDKVKEAVLKDIQVL